MSLVGKNVTLFVLMTVACCLLPSVYADLSPNEVLDRVYGGYDLKHDCWLAIDHGQRYRMKIDRTDMISSATGQRLYVLAAGDAVDDRGKPSGGHPTPGLIGAFIAEERNGQTVIVASNPSIQMGSWGSAPTKWRFVKFGPSDYWGWQNTTGNTSQGCTCSYYSILAPGGNTIRELAGFSEGFSDEGACTNERCTSLSSVLEIDSTKIGEKVFPLLITVIGKKEGEILEPKTWTVLFDTAKCSYVKPKDWPFTGLSDW